MKNIILALATIALVSCGHHSLYPYESIRGHERLDCYRHSSCESLRAQAAAFDANLTNNTFAPVMCKSCNGHGYTHEIAKDVCTNEMKIAAQECQYCRGLGVVKVPVVNVNTFYNVH